jgi:hypothetical protein
VPKVQIDSDLQHVGTDGASSITTIAESSEKELPTTKAALSEGDGSDNGSGGSASDDDEGEGSDGNHSSCSYDSENDLQDTYASGVDSDQSDDGVASDHDATKYTKLTVLVAPVVAEKSTKSRAVEHKDDSKKGKQRPPKVLQANSSKALKAQKTKK